MPNVAVIDLTPGLWSEGLSIPRGTPDVDRQQVLTCVQSPHVRTVPVLTDIGAFMNRLVIICLLAR